MNIFRLTVVSSKENDAGDEVFLAQVHRPLWIEYGIAGVDTVATYVLCTGVAINRSPAAVLKPFISVASSHVAIFSLCDIL